MNNLKLTIITVNYNNAIGLEKTINSVISQSYKELEYLVIDGNSTDTSVNIIEKFNDSISYWVSEPDSGIYNAMNKGIFKAQGDYILFLNSGDVFATDDSLSHQLICQIHTSDIIYCDYKFENGEKIYPETLTPLFFFKSSLPHQSSLIKRSLFEEFGIYDEKYEIVADWEFYIKCFLSNKVVFKHIKHPLTIFDLNGISNHENHKLKHEKERVKVLKKYFGVHYDEYKKQLQLEKELSRAKRNSIAGILKRIKNRLSIK